MWLLTSSCEAASMDTSEEVERRKEEDPHQVDEVPVEAGVLDAVGEVLGVGGPHLRPGREQEGVDDDAADDVQAVEPGQREVDGVEIVVRGEVAEVEFVLVFEVLDDEEDEGQRDRSAHPQ